MGFLYAFFKETPVGLPGTIAIEQRSAFIKAARKRYTDIDSSLSVSRHDRRLPQVTCTGGTHPWYWVVHAVLVEEEQ